MDLENIQWDEVNPDCDPEEENSTQIVRKYRKRTKIEIDTADFSKLTVREPSAVDSSVPTPEPSLVEPSHEEESSIEDELSKSYTRRKSKKIQVVMADFSDITVEVENYDQALVFRPDFESTRIGSTGSSVLTKSLQSGHSVEQSRLFKPNCILVIILTPFFDSYFPIQDQFLLPIFEK